MTTKTTNDLTPTEKKNNPTEMREKIDWQTTAAAAPRINCRAVHTFVDMSFLLFTRALSRFFSVISCIYGEDSLYLGHSDRKERRYNNNNIERPRNIHSRSETLYFFFFLLFLVASFVLVCVWVVRTITNIYRYCFLIPLHIPCLSWPSSMPVQVEQYGLSIEWFD